MEQEEIQQEEPKMRVPYHLHQDYIMYNLNIPHGAEKLFCVLEFYSKKKGCFAGNAHLSKIMFVDERTISKYLSILEDWGYIFIKDKKKRSRMIFANNKVIDGYRNAAHDVFELKDSDMELNDMIKKAKQIFLDAKDEYFKKEKK